MLAEAARCIASGAVGAQAVPARAPHDASSRGPHVKSATLFGEHRALC